MQGIRAKVLLVEDDKLDRMAFERMVESEKLSYDCTVAGSVSKALELLRDEHFDIVVSDYYLGDGTAFDVLAAACDIPAIFVTGAGDEEIAIKAWKSGAYDYVVKDSGRSYLKRIPITIEHALERAKMAGRLRLLSHAVLSTTDSVYITDLQGRITFVNRAFTETYGYDEDEIIGQDCDMLWGDNPLSEVNWDCAAVNGWEVGFFHRRKDGKGFAVSLSRSDVKEESGNVVAIVVVSRDISERMEVENELRSANRELAEQDEQKKQLLRLVCEEFDEQLGDLRAAIEAAESNMAGQSCDQSNENLDSAMNHIDQMQSTVADVLETTNSESINISAGADAS